MVLDARLVAKVTERSIAGQIEFWARLGRAIEPLLEGQKTLSLKESGDRKSLASLLATVDHPEGRRRVSDYLATQPYPHYEVAADKPGMLVRIDESGTRTVGRFVNREFVPLEGTASKTAESWTSRSSAISRKKIEPKADYKLIIS